MFGNLVEVSKAQKTLKQPLEIKIKIYRPQTITNIWIWIFFKISNLKTIDFTAKFVSNLNRRIFETFYFSKNVNNLKVIHLIEKSYSLKNCLQCKNLPKFMPKSKNF